MKKIALITIGFTFLLTSCVSSNNAGEVKQKKNSKSQWINSNIKGNYLPAKSALQDDFYQSVNYEKFTAPDNPQIVNEGNVYDAQKNIREQMIEVLKNEDSENPEHKILHQFYKQAMDWEKRNSVGLNPILPYIKKINSVQTLSDLESLFDDNFLRYFMPLYLNLNTAPSVIIDYVQLFKNKDASFEFYTKMLSKVGFSAAESEEKIKNAIAFEEQIFAKNTDFGYPVSYAGIEDIFMNYPIKKYLASLDLPEKFTQYDFQYIVLYQERFKFIDSLYTNENLENFKTVMLCKVLLFSSTVTDRESFELNMEFMKQLNGANNYENDDFTVVNYLNTNLPGLIGKIWMDEYFSKETLEDAKNLILQIVEEYKTQISNWDWISDSMKYLVSLLLDNITIVLGPTEGFNDYSKIDINKQTFCESAISIINYSKADSYNLILKSEDPKNCIYYPQVYNAFCYVTGFDYVSINVLAGFLCGNKYSPELPFEEKLGILGTVMGHELSHIFVTTQNGGNFLAGLWKSDDLAQMQKVLKPLIDLMNSKEVLPEKYCNGEFKIPEMGADYFGMNICLKIAEKTPDFNYDLFFQTYAKNHYVKATMELVEEQYIDVHPMSYLRGNCILQQFEEFYETYGIKKGDGMYLAPGKRVKL